MLKYRALFVEESREHVQALSRRAVELESAADAAPIIKDISRHAHSIKGMAASMGYEPITNLAHRIEDLVALFPGASLEAGTIDLLLRGVDALASQVECIAQEKPLAGHHDVLHALTAHLRERAAAAAEKASEPEPEAEAASRSGTKLKSEPAAPAVPGRKLVVVRLDEATAMPPVRAFLVHRRLSALCEIFTSDPTLEQIKARRFTGLELRFTVGEALDEEACRSALANVPEVERVEFRPVETAPPLETTADGRVVTGATVRVRTGLLDSLLDSVGELFIARQHLRSLLGTHLKPELRAALDVLAARIHDVHGRVMSVRMMPLVTLTDRFPRLVRDVSRSLGKDAQLFIDGGEIELDRAILDDLDAPLVHVIRNALDHGIESPAERLEVGKPSTGRLEISASRDRDTVLVVVADDGRGLDSDALRQEAIERGLLTEAQAEAMSAREANFIICHPGFSTKGEVSDLSGRGVGMDVVRSGIEALGGSLDIESELGRGTRFIFRLPLTLAIIPVLLVEAARRTFAVPAAKVVAVREPGEDIFEQAGGNVYLSFQHALVQVQPLATFLKLLPRARIEQVVVLEEGRDLYALAVDRIFGYQEVVVKPLGDPLESLEWFSGATVLGDGQPALILDMPKALRLRTAA